MKYVLLTLLLLTPVVMRAKKHKLDPANPADFPLTVHVVRVEHGEGVYVGNSYDYAIMVVQEDGDSKTYRMRTDGARSVPLSMGTYRGCWRDGDLAISYSYPIKSNESKLYVDWLRIIAEE